MSAPEPSQRSGGASRSSASEHRALLATCVAAAARGAEVIRSFEGKRASLRWEEKSRTDFVSDVDRSSEHAIRELVAGRHPDARVIGEELSPDASALEGLAFVVDPLDGTTNYLHGFPWYAVSIAATMDGAPVAGAVLNVPTGELFTATAGGGARRGGQPMRVSSIDVPSRALVGTGFPFKRSEDVERYIAIMREVMSATSGIRRPGSAALDLADVACGRFDVFWEHMLAPWDLAAGVLLVREAGGVVSDLQGVPAAVKHTGIVAGNPPMHEWLLEKVRKAGGQDVER
jgi:myo-inositol-1(or 4)-monophosphatase